MVAGAGFAGHVVTGGESMVAGASFAGHAVPSGESMVAGASLEAWDCRESVISVLNMMLLRETRQGSRELHYSLVKHLGSKCTFTNNNSNNYGDLSNALTKISTTRFTIAMYKQTLIKRDSITLATEHFNDYNNTQIHAFKQFSHHIVYTYT